MYDHSADPPRPAQGRDAAPPDPQAGPPASGWNAAPPYPQADAPPPGWNTAPPYAGAEAPGWSGAPPRPGAGWHTQPAPAYGAPAPPPAQPGWGRRPGPYPAGMGERFGGAVIDSFVGVAAFLASVMAAVAVLQPLEGPVPDWVLGYLMLGVGLLSQWLYWALPTGLTGRTLGKKIVGTRVLSVRTGRPPGLGWATLRWLVYVVLSLFGWIYLIVIIVMMSNSPDRRTLHDLASNTWVVNVPKQPRH
ncbi:RDD family protein [Allonocardiopsis opalescens]|uniref:Putative RDD family membrane protein YckC n=1 Tax=Allonocardiopsis opalescens TaxID=1144618 RepID=A0A2T0PX86_9ACTN|nr:RDD family protein [Allonocardiopsis opalescens]PRX96154.1 putative RDD family membrane protein YckC [Allonocardiopsis opalescens]